MINLIVGGSSVSGAEKRLVKTMCLLAEQKNIEANLVVTNSMRKELQKRKLLDEFGSGFSNIYEFKFHKFKAITQISLFFLLVRICLSQRGRSVFYCSLINPLILLPFVKCSKLIYEVTSPDIAKNKYLHFVIRVLGGRIKVIAVSENVSKILHLELKNKKVKNENVCFREYPFNDLPEVFELNKEKVVVFAHRMVERKNPILIAYIFTDIAKYNPDWVFMVFGDGPLSEDVRRICDDSCLDNVVFAGEARNLVDYLKRSSVFISLIEPDNYPSQSVFEAMACKNALIVSNTGIGSHRFISGNGYLVDLDENLIKDKLQKIINLSDAELDLLRENSSILVKENFSLERYLVESLRLIYD